MALSSDGAFGSGLRKLPPPGIRPGGGWCRTLAALGLVTLSVATSAAPPAAAGTDVAIEPGSQCSATTTIPKRGSYELGFQAAYSFGISDDAQMVTFMPRVGRVVLVTQGRTPGVLSFNVEGLFSRVFESSHAMQIGGGLLVRYRLLIGRVQPYAELGGGMLYSDLRGFFLGSRILFTVQPGLGFEVPLGRGFALTAGYRFRHVSNGGQSRNPGLDSNLFAVGFSYLP